MLALHAAPVALDVDFHSQVAPVLMEHCFECHGGEQSKGGFSINTLELILDKEAAVRGDASASLLIELIEDDDEDFAMPPVGKARLTDEEIGVLRSWIDEGLAWEDGFTFAKSRYSPPLLPRVPELPEAVDGRGNAIDRIIDAFQREHGVARAERADDAAFYRRLSLDLLGTLPDPADVARFVKDEGPEKRAGLVDQLLAENVDYARHWLTFWNDLLRNDYTGTGYITGGRKSVSNWLYGALLENKPYDQLAAELLSPTEESRGFADGIRWRGDVNASQTTEIQFAQNVGQVFLGINIKCASCHDSFIDRWTLDDAYGLAAITSERPLEQFRCDKPTGEMATPKWLFPELGQIDPEAPRADRLRQLAALMTSPDNGRFTRTVVNRFVHRMLGRGIVEPVDAMQTEPWSADLLDYLAVRFAGDGYDLKALLGLIAKSEAYGAQTVKRGEASIDTDYRFAGPLVKRMTAEQFVDGIRQVTGTQTTDVAAKFSALEIEKEAGYVGRTAGTRASMLPTDFLQRSLGRPFREQVVTQRPQELTGLQALDLANGEALNGMLQAGAAELMSRHGELGTGGLVEVIFQRALSRGPSEAERTVSRALVGEPMAAAGIEDLLWSVFMLPEFQLVR